MKKFRPYLFTLTIVAITSGLKFLLKQELGLNSPLLLYATAITICAWYGGSRQGVFATLLSLVCVVTGLKPPETGISAQWLALLGLFAVDLLTITWLCKQLRLKEKVLRLKEGQLRRIFDANMIGLVHTHKDGNILEANDYFLKLMGADRSDLEAGRLSWNDFTPAESRQASLQAVSEMLSKGFCDPFEKIYIAKDGRRVTAYVGGARLDHSTSVAYLLDVTALKTAEASLEEINIRLEDKVAERTAELKLALEKLHGSQEFLNSVIEHIPNMLFVKDAESLCFVRFNKAGEQLLGIQRDELIGKGDRDFFSAKQASEFMSADRNVLAGKKMLDIPEEPIATSRGTRYLHTKKIPLLDADGEARYLLGISEDITEKKFAEQQREEFVRIHAEKALAEITACRLAFLTKTASALNESLDVPLMMKALGKVISEETQGCCAIDLNTSKSGRWERVATFGECAGKNCGQEDLGELVGSFDETDKGLIKARLVLQFQEKPLGIITLSIPKANDKLQWSPHLARQLSEQASLAITTASLYARASEANQAKSAFLANISHEIRTPLGAILGYASLTREGTNLTPDQIEAQETILRNGNQLLRLLDDILDLSKVESEHLHIESLPLSPRRVLEEVVSLMKSKAQQRGLRLGLEFEGEIPPMVMGDPLRLKQILFNIVGNGIKFTAMGGVFIKARYQQEKLHITITDTGIGLTPEQAERLFQPFVQADGSMARKFGGTGLGLFLSRKLAQLLGGNVVLLKSEPGKGTTFSISLLMKPTEAVTVASPTATEAISLDGLKDAHVLVVDDSPDNRVLFKAFLRSTGIQVTVAENGKQALEIVKKSDVDMIFMDLQMPEMDGFEALKGLRRLGCKRPVVALTAHTMKGDREKCLDEGFDDYLAKPVGKLGLLHCISRHAQPPGSAPNLI